MANSSSKLSSLNVSPMDFPYSIISDQYDLFMNKIIGDWLWENPPVTHKDNYLEKRN